MSKKKIKDTKISSKIEQLTIESFLDHYAQLRYVFWDGSERIDSGDKYYVFEHVPSTTSTKANSRISHKFHREEEALAFLNEKRDELKEQLLTVFMDLIGEKDGPVTKVDSGSEGVGGEQSAHNSVSNNVVD